MVKVPTEIDLQLRKSGQEHALAWWDQLSESERCELVDQLQAIHFDQLRDLYAGECQICGWAPRTHYGAEICEAHHVRWLSRGGDDTLSNLVLICPNHHRAIHRCDAPFDFEHNAFVFPNVTEGLTRVQHVLEAR